MAWRLSQPHGQLINQFCLCNTASIKTKRAWASFSGWQYSGCMVTHWCHTLMLVNYPDSPGGKQTETLHLEPSRTLSLPLPDLNLCTFPGTDPNYEHSHFQWVLWVFLEITKPEGGFWDPVNLQLVSEVRMVLETLSSDFAVGPQFLTCTFLRPQALGIRN